MRAAALRPAPGDAARAPPFKWVGSKAHLCRKHAHLLPAPATVQRLVLPFCGAGSVALHYAAVPVRFLSDTNADLVNALRVVRDMPETLIAKLGDIAAAGYCRERYEHLVERLNTEPEASVLLRAAWTFVILQWGFNGLWRVNRKGEVNVAFGKPRKPGTVPKLFDADNLRAVSHALRGAEIEVLDFEEQVRRARPQRGDLFYFDPPFMPASKTANFTGYTPGGFSGPAPARSDAGQVALFGEPQRELTAQERLAAFLPELDAAGARWALSNSDTAAARALYQRPGWNTLRLERSGGVSCDVEGRGKVGEILVRNYE